LALQKGWRYAPDGRVSDRRLPDIHDRLLPRSALRGTSFKGVGRVFGGMLVFGYCMFLFAVIAQG
jgi:hypothetical protein